MKLRAARWKRTGWAAASIIAAVALAFALFLFHSRQRSSPGGAVFSYFSHPESWMAYGGTWIATANGIENSSSERGSKFIFQRHSWSNFQVDADLATTDAFAEAGFLLRASGAEEGVDAYHGYYAGFRAMDGSVELGRADYGWHPMARADLPAGFSGARWVHLHAVAVGCAIGVEISAPGIAPTALLVHDAPCIRDGMFGLRSSYAMATWKNLRILSAHESDLKEIEQRAAGTALTRDLAPGEPSSSNGIRRFLAAVQSEAEKRQARPGVTPISSYRLSPGAHPDVTIQGTIISLPPFTDIQDNTGTIMVPDVDAQIPLKLGDVVEARGTLVTERFRSRLEHARLRILWSDLPYPPLAVTAAQLTSGSYRGRFIEVEGTLLSAQRVNNGYELILMDGDQTFRATGQHGFHVDLASLKPGSRLRVRGNATALDAFTHGVYPFAVIADRIDVLRGPPWWSPVHIIWLIAAGLGVLLAVQWGLHRLRAWHVSLLLREREELAFEMHDTLAQDFTGIAYQLQAAVAETRGAAEVRKQIENALKMVRRSHREASRTIAALRPQYRRASDIVTALRELAERLSDGGHLRILARADGKNAELPLAVTDALFRIGQEAVTNAIQHADCKTVEVVLELMRGEARLTVRDDGRGAPDAGDSPGLGIAGMRNRTAKVHGRFEFLTRPAEGTTVSVVVPLRRAPSLFARI